MAGPSLRIRPCPGEPSARLVGAGGPPYAALQDRGHGRHGGKALKRNQAGKEVEWIDLPGAPPGTRRRLQVIRWRRGAGPRVYVQAALHADEIPPLLVAHHLERLIDARLADGSLRGEVILVPFANPLGLDQFVGGLHHGRFDLDSGGNFNRGYPDVAEALAARVGERLGGDPAANVAEIRGALRELLDGVLPPDPHRALKHTLFRLAADCDVVLDLHCDFQACLHLYVNAPHWPRASDLAHALQSEIVLLADDSGGGAFDEACARIFTALAARFPQHPIPPACLAVTVELRGERDVDDETARIDAEGILRFLCARGAIAGEADLPGEPARATRLEAVDVVSAPAAGVLVWDRPLGCEVEKGDVLGWIVVPGEPRRLPLLASTTGLFFVRRGHHWVKSGQVVAKIAGAEPLPWRQPGALLYD